MLHLSDFITCSKCFIYLEWGFHVSALEHCKTATMFFSKKLFLVSISFYNVNQKPKSPKLDFFCETQRYNSAMCLFECLLCFLIYSLDGAFSQYGHLNRVYFNCQTLVGKKKMFYCGKSNYLYTQRYK